jgi:ribosomal protein L32
MSVCPSCGHRNQPGAKFCSECGVALAEARLPSYEERKVVISGTRLVLAGSIRHQAHLVPSREPVGGCP